MNKEERLMMSEEEVRQRVKELLNLPKEDLLTQYLFLQQENQELKRNCNIGYENLNFYREENQKYKEVIDKAIELLNQPWSFESGNKRVDEITKNKKWEIINLLKEVE